MLRVLLIAVACSSLIACQPRDPKPADSPADPPTPMSPSSQAAPSVSRVSRGQTGRQAEDRGPAAIGTAGLSC